MNSQECNQFIPFLRWHGLKTFLKSERPYVEGRGVGGLVNRVVAEVAFLKKRKSSPKPFATTGRWP